MDSKKYDVVVCGAGVAGVAAAIAAARRGMRTAIIEKQCLLGGLATSGLIYIFLPLCDGFGHQVTSGIAEEMIRRCTAYSPFNPPERWGGPKNGNPGIDGDRFQCCFSPAGFTLTLDTMLAEAGVDLWLDTTIFEARTEELRLASVLVVNASGHTRIDARCFVDATGGAAVAQMAGGEVQQGENYLTPWFMEMSETPEYFHFSESLHVQCAGAIKPEFKYPECHSGEQVSRFVRETWRLIRERYDALPQESAEKNYPVHLPAMPQLRKIARVKGLETLSDEDHGKRFESSVGLYADWRKPGFVWETPYGVLLPEKVRGMLAAGRCISTEGDAWEVFRVIPAAAMTGEIAGVGAALAVELRRDPMELTPEQVRRELKKNRFKFHLEEMALPVERS